MADEKTPKPTIETTVPERSASAPAPVSVAVASEPEPDVSAAASETASADAQPSASTPAPALSFTERVTAWVHSTFPGNEHAFWGGVCGLVVALTFFAIGLWRTIVILVLVLAGVAIGQVRDGKTGVVDALRHFFSSNR